MKKILWTIGALVIIIALGWGAFVAFAPNGNVDVSTIDTSKLNLSQDLIADYKKKYTDYSTKLDASIQKYESTKKDADKPDPDYFIEKARYAAYLGQDDAAVATLKQIFKYYQNSSVAWNNLASIYENKGDYKTAISYYQKIIDTFGEEAVGKFYLQIANDYLAMGDKQKAKEAYVNFKKWSTDRDPQLEELLKSK